MSRVKEVASGGEVSSGQEVIVVLNYVSAGCRIAEQSVDGGPLNRSGVEGVYVARREETGALHPAWTWCTYGGLKCVHVGLRN